MAWQFILTDLYGTHLGEVTGAYGRQVVVPHLRVPTAQFTIPLWHARAADVLDSDTLLKCYRTDPATGTRTLVFHGPVVSAEESAGPEGQTVQVNAASPYWRLSKRLIPGSMLTTGIGYGSETAKIDLGLIAQTILQDVNATSFTGIDVGSLTNSSAAFVTKWLQKNAAEAIAELAAGLNSFEFRVRPTEAAAYANPANWPRIGLLDCAPILGTSRPDAIFEYGTTRANVGTYKRSVTRDGLLTRAYASVSGWPDTIEKDPVTLVDKYAMQQSDADNINTRGLFEEVVSDAGVLDNTLRKQITDFHIAIRKNPRQQIIFSPAVNARPAPFVDYDVGDTVRARAVVRGTLRFDALFRIWGVTFNVDENGNEAVDLELVQP